MRVIVLALDGLDHKFIERFRLKNIKQEVRGTIDLTTEFETILSIIIWTSFITGLPPEKHGVYSPWVISSNRFMNQVFRLRWHIPIVKNMAYYRIHKILRHIGIKLRYVNKEDLKKMGLKTIFDYASEPIAINVLGYNAVPIWEYLDYELPDLSDLGMDVEPLLWKQYNDSRSLLLEAMDKEWDLLMVWINLVDWIQHLYLGRNALKVMKAYFELEKLVYEVKKKLDDECFILVVSDHGFRLSAGRIPEHSTVSFYSFNRDVPWRPNKISDFASFIIRLLKSGEQEYHSLQL